MKSIEMSRANTRHTSKPIVDGKICCVGNTEIQQAADSGNFNKYDERAVTSVPLPVQNVYIPSHITEYSNELFDCNHMKNQQHLSSVPNVSLTDNAKSMIDNASNLTLPSAWKASLITFQNNESGLTDESIIEFLKSVKGIGVDENTRQAFDKYNKLIEDRSDCGKRKQADQKIDTEITNSSYRDEVSSLTGNTGSFLPGLTNEEMSHGDDFPCFDSRKRGRYDHEQRREMKNKREKERSSRLAKQIADLQLCIR